MKYKLYAFWKHDIPPYVLGGEVTEIKSNGRVCVKGFTGYSFLPLQILPLEEGRAKQKEIDLALKNYKNTIKKAEDELRSHTKQLLLKYTLTEIGHEHVSDFLKECSAKRKEILDAGLDTACQTTLPTKADILRDLNDGENIDDSGEYDSDWAVTDNTDEDFAYVKCRLTYGIDYFIREDTDTDEDTLLWDILQKHRGHKVSIVSYGDNDAPANIALECEDCGEVILDAGIYTIYARKDS